METKDLYMSAGELTNDNTISGGKSDHICCVHVIFHCSSLDDPVENLVNNVLLNITSDVKLSSFTTASNLVNVPIVGYNNPTVKCKSGGGVHLVSCHNCIIQGIVWNGCGIPSKPAIRLSTCSNTIIEKCSFKSSKGQVLVLSEASTDIYINYCNFLHNNQYSGHGAAIHHSISNTQAEISFSISHCNFTYNKGAESLVCIDSTSSKPNSNLVIDNSSFCHNEGVSIYVVKWNVYIYGNNLFQSNLADRGAAIYMKNKTAFIFGDNSKVTFTYNSAKYGAVIVCSYYDHLSFQGNASTVFSKNDVAFNVGTCVEHC